MDALAEEMEMFQVIEGKQERKKKAKDGQRYTTDYIESLPEDTRVELINGRIYDMASPTWTHQRIIVEMMVTISDYIKKKGGPCKVAPSPVAVYLNNDKRTYVEPDIVVVCDPEKIDDKGCHGAPDWIIEIVSPTSVQMDYLIKQFKYQGAGVREYWIVDPEQGKVWKYDYESNEIGEYTLSDTVPAGIYPDLEIDFKEVMANV